MKLLYLTPYLPSPPRSGGPRRLHGLISGLARDHDVTVLSLVAPGDDIAAMTQATGAYCAEVVTVMNERYALAGRRKRLVQLASLASPSSYERLVYRRPAFQAALGRLLARERFDVVTVEFAQMAGYRLPRATPIILDEHNIEYDILRRTGAVETQPARKLYNLLDYRKLRAEERRAWRRVAGCAFTSRRDEAVLRASYPRVPTAVVPNGVDVEVFRPAEAEPDPSSILFFGAIDYYPNTEGLLFFLREVFPLVKRRHPAARLTIVGPSPPEAITHWAGEDVAVTGFVDDVCPSIARAAVVIAPLRIGGGTRLKIVEAMAMGKAIVATTLGAEGLDVVDGRDLLLADSAERFAARVGDLLEDGALRRRLGAAARLLAERRYSWRASVARLAGFYEEVLAARRSAPARGRAAPAPGTRAG